jgi:HEAT repeat protein
MARCAAAVALVALLPVTPVHGQKYSFEEVSSGLKHQDVATRLRAIQILTDADYAEAAVPIAAAIADPDDRVQLAAISAEGALFTARPVSRRRKVGFVVEVRSTGRDDFAAERQLALKARAIPAQVISGLTIAMRDQNPRVRAEAISLFALLAPQACGGERCTEAGNVLIDAINSRQPLLRRSAMHALGQLRYANAVQALWDQFSYYQNGADALAALEALAAIGDPAAASVFREALKSSNVDARRFAVEGLARARITEDAVELQQMGQIERSSGVLLALHYAAVKLDAAWGEPGQLVSALRDSSLRALALKYLLDLAPSMAPALVEYLRDADTDVRRLIADVLGFSRDAAVVPALEVAAKDGDPDVALAAQTALDRIKLR